MHLCNRIATLIYIVIFASAMSFFGFVYEQIDFIPNYFGLSPINAKIQWTSFHSITNPAFYHILPSIVTVFCVLMLWFYKHNLLIHQLRKLKIVSALVIVINILTGIAVTQINEKLYFDTSIIETKEVKNLAISWTLLNFSRLSLVAICIKILVKMFSIKLITNKKGTQKMSPDSSIY